MKIGKHLEKPSETEIEPAAHKGIGGLIARFNVLPRVSDPKQKRAGASLIKFLALLLLLTIVARGTSGATLARVDVSAPARDEIVESVSGTATVSARDTMGLNAPEGLTVMETIAGVGQTVETGDIVARFDLDEIKEKLLRANAALDKQRLDLAKLERGETADSSSLESAQRSLNRANEDYNTTKTQGEADIATAQKTLQEAMDKAVDTADASNLESAQRSLKRAQEDYDSAKSQADADASGAYSTYANAKNTENAKLLELNTAQEALDAALALNPSDPGIPALEASVEAASRAYQSAKSDTDKAYSAYVSAQSKSSDSLTNAARKVEDAQTSLAKAERDYAKSQQSASDSWQSDIDKAKTSLESAKSKAEDNLKSAARKVEDAQISLAKAEKDYGKSAQSASDTATQNQISAVSARLDLAAQKEVVDALQLLLNNNGVLYADVSGVISAIKQEGSVTGKDDMVTFTDSARGFEAKLQLSKDDADKLAVGGDCQVSTGGGSMYFTPTVTGTVYSISSPDENDRVQLVIRLPAGSWTAGQRVSVETILSQKTYEQCVPISALRSDNTGYYLFTVEKKSTVLGVENVVTRVSVTVSAMDGDMAAVQGPIDRNSQIITGSGKSVSAGDRVRVNS